jgi:HK97 family phage major capsid protein
MVLRQRGHESVMRQRVQVFKFISNKGLTMSEILSNAVEQRQKLWHEAKAVLDTAEAEKRELTAEEQGKFETLSAELDKRAAFIETARKMAEREERAAAVAEGFTVPSAKTAVDADNIRAIARGEVRSFEFAEKRDLAPATSGAPVPTSFYNQVIMKAKYVGPMLTTSTILNTASGEPLQIPSVSAYSTGSLTAAGSVLSENDPSFNSFVTLQSWKYGGVIRVARELLEDTGVDLLGFLADEIGIGLGSSVNAALTTGTGTTQPLGISTAAGSGITGGTGVSGAFTADNLIDLVYSLDTAARRRPGAGFQMNSASIAAVRKLKDNYGRYIFEPALSADKYDLLLGYNIYENPDLASPATGAKSVLFGDLASYYVRQVGGIRLDRSDDFAFANDQVTFRYTMRLDGNLPQTSHIKFFKGAAS